MERLVTQQACTAPAGRRAAYVLGAALLVLFVSCGEVKLIEQASAMGASCGIGLPGEVMRIVDSSLTSGFSPIAILR
jgi:hypothetical protein